MTLRLRAVAFAICSLAFAVPAVAQLDSSALRAKYGSPLNRETFHMSSGFDLVVDYGFGNQVCKMEMPALMPTTAQVARTDDMKKQMRDFLAELVPASMRGKELRGFASVMGLNSSLSTEYEHVTITEMRRDDQPFGGTITVIFNRPDCQQPAAQ